MSHDVCLPFSKQRTVTSPVATAVDSLSELQSLDEAVDFLRSQLLAMSGMVQTLESQTGQRSPELEETSMSMLTELSRVMGVPLESLHAPVESTVTDSTHTDTGEAEGATAPPAADQTVSKLENSTEAEAVEAHATCSPTAAERRETGLHFVEVSEEEFASVSELIRGRAKLEDVNRTYGMLWDHFKVQNQTGELTPKEMNAMGLRVTGATGQAKLKILRALKLCKISKSGNVSLL
ncbi:spindle and kinetochore-associated protein 2-like [Elysia marginata]|uniref:Spindle and kinetochore-associated protein 2-like n=1 Tax=Elysia marginata TaxID=1093978 RepID=A0AAV4FH51_9GAST|nr:spindle and kinetochore-associated protein 2-like [Elysia marginata]